MRRRARREREGRRTGARDVGVVVGLEDAVDALAETNACRRRRSLWAGLFWIPAQYDSQRRATVGLFTFHFLLVQVHTKLEFIQFDLISFVLVKRTVRFFDSFVLLVYRQYKVNFVTSHHACMMHLPVLLGYCIFFLKKKSNNKTKPIDRLFTQLITVPAIYDKEYIIIIGTPCQQSYLYFFN